MYPGHLFELPSVLLCIFKYNFAFVPAFELIILLFYQADKKKAGQNREKRKFATSRKPAAISQFKVEYKQQQSNMPPQKKRL
jgi:hypothetical protein